MYLIIAYLFLLACSIYWQYLVLREKKATYETHVLGNTKRNQEHDTTVE